MNLRDQVMRGGFFLVLRQGLGVTVGFVGMVMLTRAIGPVAYGQYSAAFAIYTYLFGLAQMGLNVYLVRRPGEISDKDYDAAFTLLLMMSGIGVVLGFLSIPLLKPWMRMDCFGPIATALMVGLPMQLLTTVPMGRFERALDYQRVAWIEMSGRLMCYFVALPLAWLGFGVWAPVGGWWSEQLTVCVGTFWVSKFRPRLRWDRELAGEMIRYGLGYSGAAWIRQLNNLVNPLLVGRYLGAEAVGYVALAIRLVEGLGFAMLATWRLSMSALARVQEDRVRLTNAISEGMRLQLLALGPLLVGFAWLSPWFLPMFFGNRWDPVIGIYPFVAVYYMGNAIFNMHSSALYVLKHNSEVAVVNLVNVVLMAVGTFLLVPQMGLVGYGWALAVALLSCGGGHYFAVRHIGQPDYKLAMVWFATMALALFSVRLGPWASAGLGVALCWPGTLRELRRYVGEFKKLRGGGRAVAAAGKP
jgi:PST family polysaccharide transporter